MKEDDKTIFIEKNLLSTDRNRPKHKRHYEELYTKEYIDELLKNTVGNPVLVGTNLNFTQVDGTIIPIDLSTIGGGEYIPLTGTEVGSPVTGDIEFSDLDQIGIIQNNEVENLIGRFWFNDGSPLIMLEDLVSEYESYISLGTIKIGINGSNPIFKGLVGTSYFGANYDSNTYVQKKYVDDNFAKVGTTAPASATATGKVGEIRVTATFIYTCVATNTWVRAAVATW